MKGQCAGDSDVELTNDDNFRQDWEKFSGMNDHAFEDYFSVDSNVATSGVETVQQLCESLAAASRSAEGEGEVEEDEDGEPEVVPNFVEAHEALMKVKSFFYAQSTSDSDSQSVLRLENSFFELRRKMCTNQKSIKDYFCKKYSPFILA